jgi:hypothetical protein
VNRNPGTGRLATKARSIQPPTAPLHRAGSGGPTIQSSEAGRTPNANPLAFAGTPRIVFRHTKGVRPGGAILLLGLLPLLLSACAIPTRLQGDTTSGNWYAKARLAQF